MRCGELQSAPVAGATAERNLMSQRMYVHNTLLLACPIIISPLLPHQQCTRLLYLLCGHKQVNTRKQSRSQRLDFDKNQESSLDSTVRAVLVLVHVELTARKCLVSCATLELVF